MAKDKALENEARDGDDRPTNGGEAEDGEFRVEDRRHWNVDEADGEKDSDEPERRTAIDEYRERAEEAEQKLQEYIQAFKRHREEQERVRERLRRDVDRKVELKFGGLVGDLLETVDDLDRGLQHAAGDADPDTLVEGMQLVRDRFVATLERHGIQRLELDGQAFDPIQAEALRVDPVESPAQDGMVTQTLRPGYTLGERVIRPARVAVGRRTEPGSDG